MSLFPRVGERFVTRFSGDYFVPKLSRAPSSNGEQAIDIYLVL
jgi:nitrogenase molybdenum-iron protein alpha/beta subunit